MTVETIAPDTDDLDAFEALFTGKEPSPVPEEKPAEEALGEETPAPSQEEEATLEGEDEEVPNPEKDDSAFKTGKQKLTARERIEQLNTKFREEERVRLEKEARIQELETRLREVETKEPKVEQKPVAVNDGPTPDDLDANGDPKYPLGNYDPDYIADLHRFNADKIRQEIQEESRRQQEEAQRSAALNAIQEDWNSRLQETEQAHPDIREKGIALEGALSGTDPALLEYMATTIMSLDNGPEVLYYLSENIDEAKKIVSSGAVGATIALGRLDAFVGKPKQETRKITETPTPPPTLSRGSSGKFAVPADTDDLDAFQEAFFRKG